MVSPCTHIVVGVCHLTVAYPGGDQGVRTPPSASTSLIIHYSQSTYGSLHDTAQLAPAPSEKTITGAASNRYALEVDRTGAGSRSKPHLPTICACAKIKIHAEHPPVTNPGYATA